jgi:cell division topological specificity factor
MLDFFSRFFRRDGSSATAKERLRLVLLSDHLSLAPETVDALKSELIEVISRYVKIDTRLCEVTFEQQASTVAMHANIPILGLQTDRPAVAAPLLVDAPRSMTGDVEHAGPGYLDSLHDEVLKATPVSSAYKPDVEDHANSESDEAMAQNRQ